MIKEESMLYEKTRQQLDEMKGWTVERYELLGELQWLKLGEAIANAERVRPQYGNAAPDKVRRPSGENQEHRSAAFLSEDQGNRDFAECQRLASLYREAARILRDYGVLSEEELPDPDRETFARWVANGEGCITSSAYMSWVQDLVPLVDGTSDKMLALLYPAFVPSDLRGAADDDSVWLGELVERREIQAMSDGLRAQFCCYADAHDRIRASLKQHLTADLAGDALTPRRRGFSDRRLLAVSKEALSATDHAELMAEIEAEFAGWCRHCGTMPDHGGCDECGSIRGASGVSAHAADGPEV